MTLARYREIVPDWERFRRVVATPEPTALRVRTGRIAGAELEARLARLGFVLEPIPGLAHFYRVVERPYAVSQTLEHWLGLFYIQQAVMGLPAAALGARPGERVLDLCAAPGGKTTHLADRMDDRGALVAVDINEKRLRGLLGNLYRVGHPGVIVVAADGRDLPGGAEFDRVLVDAPCSAEGNLRDRDGTPLARDPSFVDRVTTAQEHLLRRAIQLVRPGGKVLYATCTFAPEENEEIVDRVLREAPVTVEPIPLDAPHAPGLTAFGRRSYHPDLARAWRVWPHQLDSGGLFMALLEKEGGPSAGEAEGWSPVPAVFPGDATTAEEAEACIAEARDDLENRWGICSGSADSWGWFVRGDSVWLHTASCWPLSAWQGRGEWRLLSVGLRALTGDRRFGLRLTNDGLRWLDDRVRARRVRLSGDELLHLLDGHGCPAGGAPAGNVALALEDDVVGRGVVSGGRLRHEIPKGRGRRLRQVLEHRAGGSVS